MSRIPREIETDFEIETARGDAVLVHVHADIGQGGPDEALLDFDGSSYWLAPDQFLKFADEVERMADLVRGQIA